MISDAPYDAKNHFRAYLREFRHTYSDPYVRAVIDVSGHLLAALPTR
jgi:hypothetical protein